MQANVQRRHRNSTIRFWIGWVARNILIPVMWFLFDEKTAKNKLYALLMILCTLPVIFLDGDATATVFIGMIAVPMFFARENWIL